MSFGLGHARRRPRGRGRGRGRRARAPSRPARPLEEAREAVTSLEKIARTTERVLSENDGSIQTIMYTPLLNYVRNDLLKKARAKVARLSGADEQEEVEDAD